MSTIPLRLTRMLPEEKSVDVFQDPDSSRWLQYRTAAEYNALGASGQPPKPDGHPDAMWLYSYRGWDWDNPDHEFVTGDLTDSLVPGEWTVCLNGAINRWISLRAFTVTGIPPLINVAEPIEVPEFGTVTITAGVMTLP